MLYNEKNEKKFSYPKIARLVMFIKIEQQKLTEVVSIIKQREYIARNILVVNT